MMLSRGCSWECVGNFQGEARLQAMLPPHRFPARRHRHQGCYRGMTTAELLRMIGIRLAAWGLLFASIAVAAGLAHEGA